MTKDPGLPPEIRSTRDSKAGRVETDSRGNTVWRWSAQNSLDSTTHLLKRLDNDDLALEPTARVPRPKSTSSRTASAAVQRSASAPLRLDEPADDEGGGFNPYNRSR